MRKQEIKERCCIGLAILAYLSGIASLVLVSGTVKCGIVMLVRVVLLLLCSYQKGRGVTAMEVAAIVLCLIWVVGKNHVFYLASVYAGLLLSAGVLFWQAKKGKKDGEKNGRGLCEKVLKVVGVSVLVISLPVTLFLSVTAATSVPLIKFMQKNMMHAENSYEEEPSQEFKIEEGCCITNVQYGEKYPNSYLDVYLTDQDPEHAPTYFFIHGGGNVWGDKQEGDPNGGDTGAGGLAWYIRQFMDAGYNVVSPNYALAPEYRYPTPILQLNDALAFLKRHGEEYGLNMQEIIIGGNSGGGQMTGALICIQLNPEYAKAVGAEAVLEADKIKAAVFSSAMINMYESYDTGDFGADFLFLQCGKAYYGYDLVNGKKEIPVFMDYLTEDFPPSFISDGNTGTFYEQAYELHEKMDELGIRNEINWYPADEAILGHDFETRGTKYSIENINKIFKFLE